MTMDDLYSVVGKNNKILYIIITFILYLIVGSRTTVLQAKQVLKFKFVPELTCDSLL